MNDAKLRILCIEDNAMNWRLVQRLLSQAGYEMHWAEEGLKGCELALELKPALILLDINLAGLSGFEVATKLRRNAELKETLIVALTAKSMRSDRETALVTGCDGFIPKPIDPFLFVGQVEAYLGGHRDHLDLGREGAVLREFSQRVVEHLEAQLREARESNRKLLEAQAESELRSRHLSRLLALSREILPIREARDIEVRVLGHLREVLGLDCLWAYRVHESGAYFAGLVATAGGLAEAAVLPVVHPMISRLEELPSGVVLLGSDLHQSPAWQQGIELGCWDPRAQPLLLPLRSRSEEDRLWGFLAGYRPEVPFHPFEAELTALYAGILQGSLENAHLVVHLEETSRALGTSYEGLESAYEELKEAQQALSAQDQKTALGGLFLNMAQQIQIPVIVLKEESVALIRFLDRQDVPAPADPLPCRRSLEQIRQAVSEVDDLVGAMLRRVGQGQTSAPEWIHLHELVAQELNLMEAGIHRSDDVRIAMDLQASRDQVFGIYADFVEIMGHLLEHARAGQPGEITVQTSGDNNRFCLEIVDDGKPIPTGLLATAFAPFPDLRAPKDTTPGRRPGRGLPACALVLETYGGSLELLPQDRGSLLRLTLQME